MAATSLQIDKVARPELAQHDASILGTCTRRFRTSPSSLCLDLAFIMDCTGSMSSYIDSARQNIRAIVEEIVVTEKSDVHLALIEYRDHPPQVSVALLERNARQRRH